MNMSAGEDLRTTLQDINADTFGDKMKDENAVGAGWISGTASERMAAYLHSLEQEPDALLKKLRLEAEDSQVPIVRIETESLIKTLLKLTKPRRILEIGTAIGYSTISMAYTVPDARIVTIENYPRRILKARANIRRAGIENRIELIEGDAGEVLRELASSAEGREGFDFIFLDAAKGQYLIWLPLIKKLMHRDSVLLADNVLQEGTVTESRFAVARRERTTHERMREFLYTIKHDESLESAVLDVGDGVSLSVML